MKRIGVRLARLLLAQSAPVRAVLFIVIFAVFSVCALNMKRPNDSWTEFVAMETIIGLPIAYALYPGEELVDSEDE